MDEGVVAKCFAAIVERALGVRSHGVVAAIGSNLKRATGGSPSSSSFPIRAMDDGVAVKDETTGGHMCCIQTCSAVVSIGSIPKEVIVAFRNE